MTCYHRIECYQPVKGGQVVFEPPSPSKKLLFKKLSVVCRQCLGCRIDHAASWSLRLYHELQFNGYEGLFTTLTYDDENMPEDHGIHHSHVQDFIKQVRRKFPGQKIVYFVCGEYGSHTSRPHYHLITFGFTPTDMEFYKSGRGKDGQNYKLFNSETLTKCWGRGHVVIGYATQQSINYTARYMLKEIETGNDYRIVDPETGEIHDRQKPYIRMSTRPAIGARWIEKYHGDCVKGFVTYDGGRKQRIPDYYLRKLEDLNPELAEDLKAKRLEAVSDPDWEKANTPEKLEQKEEVKKHKMAFFKKTQRAV